jgi:hypothetical protein
MKGSNLVTGPWHRKRGNSNERGFMIMSLGQDFGHFSAGKKKPFITIMCF